MKDKPPTQCGQHSLACNMRAGEGWLAEPLPPDEDPWVGGSLHSWAHPPSPASVRYRMGLVSAAVSIVLETAATVGAAAASPSPAVIVAL
jgi:hypothetical protein